MERLTTIKTSILTTIGILGGAMSGILGGWDKALETLLTCMSIDYATGFILAAVFHRSKKTRTGSLESNTGWKGLCKKGVILMMVIVADRIDITMGTDMARNGAIYAFIANEIVSITENAGLMGLPIPSVITNSIDILKRQKDNKEK